MDAQTTALVRMIMGVRPIEVGSLLKALFRVQRRDFTIGKFVFWLDPASYFGYELLSTGQYDPGMSAAIRDLLGSGDTFIDLGGHEGYFSVLGAYVVGGGGRVICIEPQQRQWPVIVSNFVLNRCSQCTLAPYAVAERGNQQELILAPSYNSGGSTLVSGVRGFRASFWPRQRAFMITLTELFRQYNLTRAKLIKIDIEGFELNALRSAAPLLKEHAIENLLIELHPEQLRAVGQSEEQVHEYLGSHGYRHQLLHNVHWYECADL